MLTTRRRHSCAFVPARRDSWAEVFRHHKHQPLSSSRAAKICESGGNCGCRGYARINTNRVNWPPGAPGRVSAKSAVFLFLLKAVSSVDVFELGVRRGG